MSDVPAPTPEPASATPPVPRVRSARKQFAATICVLEALVVGFAALTAFGLRAAGPGVVWGLGGALALSLVLASGLVGRPGGYVVGSVLQVGVLAAGLVLPMMWLVGGIFVALWVVALRLGGRIDRERVDRAVPPQGSPAPDGR